MGQERFIVDRRELIAGKELAGFSHSTRLPRYLSAIRGENEYCRSRHLCINVEPFNVEPLSRLANSWTVQSWRWD